MITITHNSKITKLQKSKIRKIQINRNIHRQIRFTLPLLALPSAQNLPRLSEDILEILLMSFWVYFRNNFWCLSEDILEIILMSFSVCFKNTFDVFLGIFYKKNCWYLSDDISKIYFKTLCFSEDFLEMSFSYLSYFKNKSWNLMSFWGYFRNNCFCLSEDIWKITFETRCLSEDI